MGNPKQIISPFGKCHTFFSNLIEMNVYVNHIYLKEIIHFDTKIFGHYLKNKLYIHEKSSFPSASTMSIVNILKNQPEEYEEMTTIIKKMNIIKIPAPYSDCKNFEKFPTRDICLNECYIDAFISEINCLPNVNKYHTIVLDNIFKKDIKFCKYIEYNESFETNILRKCNWKCGSFCSTNFYNVEILKEPDYEALFTSKEKFKFKIQDKLHTIVKFEPKLIFQDFIINMFNIVNLWHGTSLINLMDRIKIITILSTNFLKKFKIFKKLFTISSGKNYLIKVRFSDFYTVCLRRKYTAL